MSLLYKVKSHFLSWVSDIRLYPGGIILFGDSHYKIKGADIRNIINVIKPGDVLLRRYDHYLGSVTIPGYWSHAAIYIGEEYYVAQMLGAGLGKEDILTFTRADAMCILRCDNEDIVNKAIAKANDYLKVGVPYDYDFDDKSTKRFYCTEFVDNLFNYPVREKIGLDKIILPDYFTECNLFRSILTVRGPK
jgi:hypothetical protein